LKRPERLEKAAPASDWAKHRPDSNGFFEKAGTDTSGTSLDALHLSRLAVDAPDLLKVGVPGLGAFVVGMADLMTLHRFLSAYLTDSRHTAAPLYSADGN